MSHSSQPSQQPTACVLIIGNEILSGRTKDVNLNHIAKTLATSGIRVMEARVIPDIEDVIIDTLNTCRKQFTYVLTTGGIGPTHDDITSECIAKAFGVNLIRHPDAVEKLTARLQDRLTEGALKMADVPEGSELIENPVTAAPGFRMENVFVMAGVPQIMRGMLSSLLPYLDKGTPLVSKGVTCELPESLIAPGLDEIQKNYNGKVEIGSYPHWPSEKLCLNIVVRGIKVEDVESAINAVNSLAADLGGNPQPTEFV